MSSILVCPASSAGGHKPNFCWCCTLGIKTCVVYFILLFVSFPNRHVWLQEFGERWEVDKYLSTGGYLGENARPFFVALPKDRATSSNEDYRRQISVVDSEVLRQLRENVAGGFDEERFGNYVGFGNLKLYLEAELQRRYILHAIFFRRVLLYLNVLYGILLKTDAIGMQIFII